MYFILDKVLQAPHGGVIIKLPGDENHTRPLDYMLGHFDDFSYRDFYHVSRYKFLDKDKLKFIFNIVHMPEWVDIEISKECIDLLHNDDNTFLCLMSVLECRLSPLELMNECKRLNIPLHKVIVLCSDATSHNKVLHGIKYLCINFWESISRHHHQTLPDVSATVPEDLDIDNASKKFLCLNRNIKPHRIWLMYSILRSNMLNEGHVSFNLPSVSSLEFDETSKSHHTLKRIPQELHRDYKMALQREMYNRKLDQLDTQYVINYNDSMKKYYNDSLVSVVTESDSTKNFITEKTYKAIMNLHPFFIVGNPDQHALLQARGYETFEDLFGVDCVMNYEQAMRMWQHLGNMDITVLKRNIKEKYLDKCIHNQRLLLTRKISWNDIKDSLSTAVGTT
jgi:hypothetical protein